MRRRSSAASAAAGGATGRARPGRRRWPAPCARSTPARRRARRAARGRRSPRPGSAPGCDASPGRWSRRWPRTGWPSRTTRSRGSGRPRRRRAAASASRWAEACWCRTRSSVCSGPSRSGRPVAPYSSEPPEKTADRCSPVGSVSVERVGQVGEGVAGRGQRGHPHPVARPRRPAPSRIGVRSKATSSAPLTWYAAPVAAASASPPVT